MERGMQRSQILRPKNHISGMNFKCDSGSNARESMRADLKHDRPTASTGRGIITNIKRDSSKHSTLVRAIRDSDSSVNLMFSNLDRQYPLRMTTVFGMQRAAHE
jgi:hypothetical protein